MTLPASIFLWFPTQDHGNYGDISMLYGLDERDGGVVNDTDLGVARFMVEQSELPHGRVVPIRTLYAQMKEVTPNQSATVTHGICIVT